MNLSKVWRKVRGAAVPRYDSTIAYQRLLDHKLKEHGANRELAFAESIGSVSLETFRQQGDGQVAVLRHHGLADGMTIYDIGCGCGRTAQALARSGWSGRYIGHDILPGFITELLAKCPGYEAQVHRRPSVPVEDASLDMVFHWSVFTHLPPEECFLYLQDCFRALKPGGRTVFSFLEMSNPEHRAIFDSHVAQIANDVEIKLLDAFLHRDWVAIWARQIGFSPPEFTDGDDATHHPQFWQTLVTMTRPAAA